MGASREVVTGRLYRLDLTNHRTRQVLEVFMDRDGVEAALGRRPDFENSELSSWGRLSRSELSNLLSADPETLEEIALEPEGLAFSLVYDTRPKRHG